MRNIWCQTHLRCLDRKAGESLKNSPRNRKSLLYEVKIDLSLHILADKRGTFLALALHWNPVIAAWVLQQCQFIYFGITIRYIVVNVNNSLNVDDREQVFWKTLRTSARLKTFVWGFHFRLNQRWIIKSFNIKFRNRSEWCSVSPSSSSYEETEWHLREILLLTSIVEGRFWYFCLKLLEG